MVDFLTPYVLFAGAVFVAAPVLTQKRHREGVSQQICRVSKMPPLSSQRHLFDIPDDVAFLNCAPGLRYSGLRRKLNPWNIAPAELEMQHRSAT